MKFVRVSNLVLFHLIFLISFSCAGVDRIPAGFMDDRLQYRGFSVARPKNLEWYYNFHEQEHKKALFRKDLETSTHTFFAEVELGFLPNEIHSCENFARMFKEFYLVYDEKRFQMIEYKQEITEMQNQCCIAYTVFSVDRDAPNSGGKSLIIRELGFVVIHPTFKKGVVHGWYSERGLESELDPTLIEEGDSFLKGIQIESEPGKPVE
jgi:hypothetical protein